MSAIVVANCPACGGTSAAAVAGMSDVTRCRFLEFSRLKYRGLMDDWLDELTLTVLRCGACGHHWYREQPEPAWLMSMYEASMRLVAAQPSHAPGALIATEMRRLRALCGGDRPTLLDFGSGFGHWPQAAVAAGFAVCAFEPSRTRGAAHQGAFELVHDLYALAGRTFDAVNVEQVLEHVPAPLETLQQIRAWCRAATVVRITVPNLLRAVEGRALWSVWPFDGTRPHTLAPFEHLHGFTPRSLDALMTRAGLAPLPAARLWHHQPARQLRSLLGSVAPRLDSTYRLVRTSAAWRARSGPHAHPGAPRLP